MGEEEGPTAGAEHRVLLTGLAAKRTIPTTFSAAKAGTMQGGRVPVRARPSGRQRPLPARANRGEQWKDEELDLRRSEVQHHGEMARTNRRQARAQTAVAFAAVFAAIVALVTAFYIRRGVDVAADGVVTGAEEERLATALSSVGAEHAAQRIGGFALLRRHVGAEVMAAGDEDEEERVNAYRLYTVGLDVLEGYLKNPVERPIESAPGVLNVPNDLVYAANELKALVNMEAEVKGLRLTPEQMRGSGAAVDLSNVQLGGQSWPGIDFSWLGGYFAGIDLRAANLTESRWGEMREGKPSGRGLPRAHLQCAILTEADLIGVNLEGADLRGANLRGADLTGAKLGGADLRVADLTGAEGLTVAQLSVAKWDVATQQSLAASFDDPTADPAPNTGNCLEDFQSVPAP